LLAIAPWGIGTINSFYKSITLFCSALYCQIADQSKNVSSQLHSESMHMVQIWLLQTKGFFYCTQANGGLHGSLTPDFSES